MVFPAPCPKLRWCTAAADVQQERPRGHPLVHQPTVLRVVLGPLGREVLPVDRQDLQQEMSRTREIDPGHFMHLPNESVTTAYGNTQMAMLKAARK